MPTTFNTTKTVSESLADFRTLFARYDIEDWEPIPSEQDASYSVRWLRDDQWVTVSSYLQPTKAQNLRQCYQVVGFLFLWAARGVGGVSQGVVFIHGGLATTTDHKPEDSLAEAYATIGVEPDVSWEEVVSVYKAKSLHAHPDTGRDPDEKKVRVERQKRLNAAYELLTSARKGE